VSPKRGSRRNHRIFYARLSGSSGEILYAKPSSLLDSQAPKVLVAEYGLLLVGTTDRSARTTEGNCCRLPITVTILPFSRRLRHCGKMLLQHAVYEDIPATDFAKKTASSSIVEEANVI
jgi:hypothetical protein